MDAKKKERDYCQCEEPLDFVRSCGNCGKRFEPYSNDSDSAATAQPAQGKMVADEATRHAIALEQCSIFAADVGDNIAKAMINAATFLRASTVAPQPPADTIAVPVAEYEAMKRDAERYQYLRDPQSIGMDVHINGYFDDSFCDTRLDAAIDAAKSISCKDTTGEDV